MEDKELQIALYDGCQYYCTFCMYEHVKETQPLNKKDSMSDQDWYNLLVAAYARGFRKLSIAGRGEPTLHPSFSRIVARAYKIGFKIYLFTNGLNDKAVIKVLPLLWKLKINLNGLNDQDLKNIHKPAPGFTFDRCIASIKNILRNLSEKKYDIILNTNYVVTTQSMDGAFNFPERVNDMFSSELGTRKIFVSYLHFIDYVNTVTDNLALDYEGMQKLLLSARAHCHKKFLLEHTDLLQFIKQTEDLLERLKLLSNHSNKDINACSKHTQYTCEAHKYVASVDGNGDCYGCYNPFRVVNGLAAKDDPFLFGNVRLRSFEEVFPKGEGFNPLMDVSNKYWRPCLTCVAKGPVKD